MKRVSAVVVMLAVLVAAAAYNLRARTGSGQVSASRPEDRPARSEPARTTVSSTTRVLAGVVRADAEAAVSPKTPGRIMRLAVREGQVVAAGQVLVNMDIADVAAQVDAAREGVRAAEATLAKAIAGRAARGAELAAAVAEAKGGLDVAESRLGQAQIGLPMVADTARSDRERAEAGVRQAEAGLRQAEAALALAEDTLRRLRELEKHGGVAPVDVASAAGQAEMARAGRDAAQAALSLAESALRPARSSEPLRTQVAGHDADAARAGRDLAAKAYAAATEGRRAALLVADADVRAAAAMARQARAQLASARAAIGSGILRSPIAGVVTELTAHQGEFAQPGISVMSIVGLDALRVVVHVSSRDSGRVRRGQAAVLTSYSSAGASCTATVTELAPIVSADNRTLRLTLRSPRLSALFRPGEPVRVSLPLAQAPMAPTRRP